MEIDVNDLKARLAAHPDTLVLDVREPHEYEETNMGAVLIPLGTLMEKLPDLEARKDEYIVVHCRSGKRSLAACDVMRSMGFSQVFSLKGGILAWNEAL